MRITHLPVEKRSLDRFLPMYNVAVNLCNKMHDNRFTFVLLFDTIDPRDGSDQRFLRLFAVRTFLDEEAKSVKDMLDICQNLILGRGMCEMGDTFLDGFLAREYNDVIETQDALLLPAVHCYVFDSNRFIDGYDNTSEPSDITTTTKEPAALEALLTERKMFEKFVGAADQMKVELEESLVWQFHPAKKSKIEEDEEVPPPPSIEQQPSSSTADTPQAPAEKKKLEVTLMNTDDEKFWRRKLDRSLRKRIRNSEDGRNSSDEEEEEDLLEGEEEEEEEDSSITFMKRSSSAASMSSGHAPIYECAQSEGGKRETLTAADARFFVADGEAARMDAIGYHEEHRTTKQGYAEFSDRLAMYGEDRMNAMTRDEAIDLWLYVLRLCDNRLFSSKRLARDYGQPETRRECCVAELSLTIQHFVARNKINDILRQMYLATNTRLHKQELQNLKNFSSYCNWSAGANVTRASRIVREQLAAKGVFLEWLSCEITDGALDKFTKAIRSKPVRYLSSCKRNTTNQYDFRFIVPWPAADRSKLDGWERFIGRNVRNRSASRVLTISEFQQLRSQKQVTVTKPDGVIDKTKVFSTKWSFILMPTKTTDARNVTIDVLGDETQTRLFGHNKGIDATEDQAKQASYITIIMRRNNVTPRSVASVRSRREYMDYWRKSLEKVDPEERHRQEQTIINEIIRNARKRKAEEGLTLNESAKGMSPAAQKLLTERVNVNDVKDEAVTQVQQASLISQIDVFPSTDTLIREFVASMGMSARASREQILFLEMLLDCCNSVNSVLVNGNPGSGKSTVMMFLMRRFQQLCMCLLPTRILRERLLINGENVIQPEMVITFSAFVRRFMRYRMSPDVYSRVIERFLDNQVDRLDSTVRPALFDGQLKPQQSYQHTICYPLMALIDEYNLINWQQHFLSSEACMRLRMARIMFGDSGQSSPIKSVNDNAEMIALRCPLTIQFLENKRLLGNDDGDRHLRELLSDSIWNWHNNNANSTMNNYVRSLLQQHLCDDELTRIRNDGVILLEGVDEWFARMGELLDWYDERACRRMARTHEDTNGILERVPAMKLPILISRCNATCDRANYWAFRAIRTRIEQLLKAAKQRNDETGDEVWSEKSRHYLDNYFLEVRRSACAMTPHAWTANEYSIEDIEANMTLMTGRINDDKWCSTLTLIPGAVYRFIGTAKNLEREVLLQLVGFLPTDDTPVQAGFCACSDEQCDTCKTEEDRKSAGIGKSIKHSNLLTSTLGVGPVRDSFEGKRTKRHENMPRRMPRLLMRKLGGKSIDDDLYVISRCYYNLSRCSSVWTPNLYTGTNPRSGIKLFGYPLVPNLAVTSYRIQGETIADTDVHIDFDRMSKEHALVAVSRVRRFDRIKSIINIDRYGI